MAVVDAVGAAQAAGIAATAAETVYVGDSEVP